MSAERRPELDWIAWVVHDPAVRVRGWVAVAAMITACGGGSPARGVESRAAVNPDAPTEVSVEGEPSSPPRSVGRATTVSTASADRGGPVVDAAAVHPVLSAYANALATFDGRDVDALDIDLSRTADGDGQAISRALSYCLFRGVGGAALAATRDAKARDHARAIAALPSDAVVGRDAGESAHTRLEALSSTVSIERVRCARDRGARARRCEARIDRLASGVAVAWHLFFTVDVNAIHDDDSLVDGAAAELAGLSHPIPTVLSHAVDAGLSRAQLRRAFTRCLHDAAEGARGR